jgi:hypothetical protein
VFRQFEVDMTKSVSSLLLLFLFTLGRAGADSLDPRSEMRAAASEQADKIPPPPPSLSSIIARQPGDERVGHRLDQDQGASFNEAAHRAVVEAAHEAARSVSGGGPLPQEGPTGDAKKRNDDADANARGGAAAAHGRTVRNAKGKPTSPPGKP